MNMMFMYSSEHVAVEALSHESVLLREHNDTDRKFGYRREDARRSISLDSLFSHSVSFKVTPLSKTQH